MPSLETRHFGTLLYSEEAVFDFSHGLPAFEEEKTFVLIESPERAPLTFLQSMTRPSLCFVAIPVQAVDPNYQLAIAPEDLAELALDERRQPAVGAEVAVLALLSLRAEFA